MPANKGNKTKNTQPKGYGDLNPQEKIFVDSYVKNFDSKQAVLDAGFKVKNASMKAHWLMKRDDITKAISDKLETKRDRIHVEERDIIERLYAEACNQKDGNANSRISALRELARLMGLYQRVEDESKLKLEQEKKNTAGTTVVVNYGNRDGSSPPQRGNEKEVIEHVTKEQYEALERELEMQKSRDTYRIRKFTNNNNNDTSA
jgi:hypothetical protein